MHLATRRPVVKFAARETRDFIVFKLFGAAAVNPADRLHHRSRVSQQVTALYIVKMNNLVVTKQRV